MNEWKDLEINSLPSDILTGKYEMETLSSSNWSSSLSYTQGRYDIIISLLCDGIKFRYRKPETNL